MRLLFVAKRLTCSRNGNPGLVVSAELLYTLADAEAEEARRRTMERYRLVDAATLKKLLEAVSSEAGNP